MSLSSSDLPLELRALAAHALREAEIDVWVDAPPAAGGARLDAARRRECERALLRLMAQAMEEGDVDGRHGQALALSRFMPPLTVRHLVHAVRACEQAALGWLAAHPALGTGSGTWPALCAAIRTAASDAVAAVAEGGAGGARLRDPATALLTRPVFELALAHELVRSLRQSSGMAAILFDIDQLSLINEAHGPGAGDRLLERFGILASGFFRTHDWVAQHASDSIAVLLPGTTTDQAEQLARRFCQTVQQRLVLVDHRTDVETRVTISGVAIGVDRVTEEIAVRTVLDEAEAALVRTAMTGGNRVDCVTLLPTSVTLRGAAALLGRTLREVAGLIRAGVLPATRRGRHRYIERARIDELRRRLAAQA